MTQLSRKAKKYNPHEISVKLSIPNGLLIRTVKFYVQKSCKTVYVFKYGSLATDIENAGFKCNLVCFEVGSRGLITKNNKSQFQKIAKIAQSKCAKDLWAQSSRIAISCSYVIFNARYEKEWYDINDTF